MTTPRLDSAGAARSSADAVQGRRRRRGRRAAHGLRLRIVKIFVVALVVFVVALIGLAAGAVYALSRNLPKLGHLESSATAQTTKIYDAQGRLLAELHGAENRLVIPSSAIPAVMKQATVASEDQRFYSDHGIDFQGLVRAVLADIAAGRAVQGGSTITEQYIKNAYIGDELTISRKLREAILAWELEDRWSKDHILTAYLNTVYYGQGAYGVEAAAETYFHEHARRLTLPQAALLVAIAKLPSDYDPVYAPSDARQVRNEVLSRMVVSGYISVRPSQRRPGPADQGLCQAVEHHQRSGRLFCRLRHPGTRQTLRLCTGLRGRSAGLHQSRLRLAKRRPGRRAQHRLAA